MFDSSDDYEIVQQYVPLKDLPGFALFRLDCKLRKEYFMGSFLLGQTYEVNFLEWLARAANIPLKRKSIVESPKKEIPCETP